MIREGKGAFRVQIQVINALPKSYLAAQLVVQRIQMCAVENHEECKL